MPTRLSRIDELTRPDHTFLGADDDCYYLGEYTARAGYAFSATNDLIQNLKKPMDRRGRPEWIGPNDLMIAASALFRRLTLVTHNTGEFSRVPGLSLEDWELAQ